MVNWTNAYLGVMRGYKLNPTPESEAVRDAVRDLRLRASNRWSNGGTQVGELTMRHVVPDMPIEYRRRR